ncbi:MAG: hypothetical protein FWB86_04320 [Treponema sp.]|nr:hypothetical protein [Treponema sp.]MCL2250303.1 hypothetical protein [Treponema sp.]
MIKKLSVILLTFLICIPLITCKNNSTSAIEREELFSLEIGPLEDQIALYNLEGNRGIRRTAFTMRDGLFFIADGNSGKIVKYNSYGDLLFMIYNDETNPVPHSLKTNISSEEQATRWAFTHPLEEPGWIAVDSRKNIFVEDRLPVQEQRFDPVTKAVLDGLILHFDQDGRFVNYLGRDGIGGSPFPRIVGLSTSVNDELAVTCILPDGWDIYWFSPSGVLLYLIKISSTAVPSLPDWQQAMAFIGSITVSPDSRKLLIKADYSSDTFDQSTNTRTGSEPISSIIWTLNVEDGTYIDYIEIPLYEIIENGRQTDIKVFYSILGVSNGGLTVLYFPVDTGYSLLFVDTQSGEQRKGNIRFSNEELGYNDFYLSTEGILCAMLADHFKIKLVWWRTDQFIGEM